jgi:GT2 family glycosyltransferase
MLKSVKILLLPHKQELLVQLKLARPDQYPYDFVENRVAHQLTPIELIQQLKSMTDFSTFVNPDAVEQFIRDELTDTANAIDRIVTLMQHTIQSNQETCLSEFIYAHDTSTEDMTWSIILPVPDNPDLFLVTLEAISSNCDGYGRFEVILVRPQTVPAGIQTILNSLEGDIKIVTVEDHTGLAQQLNQGAAESQGAYLLFLDTQIAPDKDWMESLSHETQTSTSPKIFGARVVNRHGNIVHAGMVLDSNNSPVSAYLHLDAGFPHANKKRCFQMVDYFAGLHRDVFQTLDGFNPKTGQYLFLDLCLRGNQQGIHSLYLPKVHLVQLENTMNKKKSDPDAALYFYSRWHGSLWENEQQLYESDGVSQLQLDAARMTRAMEVAGR